jgi:hypothetical protein
LHKGLSLLQENPTLLVDDYSSDWLGVGRNMAKSIRHWLVATGLAEQEKKSAPLTPTSFGSIVYENDPYFVEPGTLWALHANLCNDEHLVTSWYWFFNHFRLNKFDRPLCLENLTRYITRKGVKRLPSPTTLQRDIACLLRTYAKELPPPENDPEDALECPLAELSLLTHHKNSGSYRRNEGAKQIPLPLLGYVIATAFDFSGGGSFIDLKLHEVVNQAGGPGRVFFLTPEKLYESILRAENHFTEHEIQLSNLAGERVIRIRERAPNDWLVLYYQEPHKWNLFAG